MLSQGSISAGDAGDACSMYVRHGHPVRTACGFLATPMLTGPVRSVQRDGPVRNLRSDSLRVVVVRGEGKIRNGRH